MDPNVLITGIITFAGGGALAAAVKAITDIRSGAQARDRDTVGSLRDQRDEADDRFRGARLDCDHFHNLVGRLLLQLSKEGIEPVVTVDDLIPPSQRAGADTAPPASTRRGRRKPVP